MPAGGPQGRGPGRRLGPERCAGARYWRAAVAALTRQRTSFCVGCRRARVRFGRMESGRLRHRRAPRDAARGTDYGDRNPVTFGTGGDDTLERSMDRTSAEVWAGHPMRRAGPATAATDPGRGAAAPAGLAATGCDATLVASCLYRTVAATTRTKIKAASAAVRRTPEWPRGLADRATRRAVHRRRRPRLRRHRLVRR